ncbi:MAG: leucyl aminopeptidase [Nitrospirota bacterium]
MEIVTKNIAEETVRADALVLPFFESSSPDVYASLDELIGGLIRKVVAAKEFTGRHAQVSLLHVPSINAERILLVGLGKQQDLSPERLRQAGGKAFPCLRSLGVRYAALSTALFRQTAREFGQATKAEYPQVLYFLEGGLLSLYRFTRYKKPDSSPDGSRHIKTVTVLSDERGLPLKELQVAAAAVDRARDLVNTPSNDLTPRLLASYAKELGGKALKVSILDEKECIKEGMGAYLSVAQGSNEPARFVVLEYKKGKGAPVVLIGKSVTFDSGGISIKPAEGMEKMKYDMAGGAAVLAVMKAVAELQLPVNVVGILPAAENLPGGRASKPGDVVRALSGKTIEIISTDAEGRLTLADSLGYAIKYYKPQGIIDIATLTGACSIALGGEAIAMMGTGAELMERLKRSADETGERVWQMPLYDEYKEYLKSDVADMKNAGGRKGSLVAAGYFLKEFAGDVPWVHLDIAGTAWNDKDKPYLPKGASGIGVRLLLNLLTGLRP